MSQHVVTVPKTSGSLRAVVKDLRGYGPDRFAVTFLESDSSDPKISTEESITFTLSLQWRGKEGPIKGQIVILSDITLFSGGWRAMNAYPITATA